jgi:glycosyltransferase involved in cell wall biosynthesis
MLAQPPVISVLMLAYNHEDYIAQAIQSVLDQKTDLLFELVDY